MLVEPKRETILFDEREAETQQARRRDEKWHSEVLGSGLSLQEYNENVRQTCCAAATLFLYPPTVVTVVNYWLTEYSHYGLAERDWFADMIHGLLYEAPQLNLVTSELQPTTEHHALRTPILLRCAGTELHRLPWAYLIQHLQLSPLRALAHLMQPAQRCFLARTTEGLDGAMQLGCFVYDGVWGHFYEPGFLVITAYCLHLHALMKSSGGRHQVDWLPRHRHSLRAIEYEAVHWAECHSVDDADALWRLQKDLVELYQALDTTDLEAGLCAAVTLWHAKALYCRQEMDRRAQFIMSRLGSAVRTL